jgi:hypothetical protein
MFHKQHGPLQVNRESYLAPVNNHLQTRQPEPELEIDIFLCLRTYSWHFATCTKPLYPTFTWATATAPVPPAPATPASPSLPCLLRMWHLLRTSQNIGQAPWAFDRMDMCAIKVYYIIIIIAPHSFSPYERLGLRTVVFIVAAHLIWPE